MSHVQIKDVALDTDVLVGVYNDCIVPINYSAPITELNVRIIGNYTRTGERCIAWKGYKHFGQRDIPSHSHRWTVSDNYEMIPSYKEFRYYKWVTPDFIVQIIDMIISPDQKCIGCDLPAPHAKSNTKDNKFQCISCKVLRELQ
jgi:hypothetical protein